MTRTHMRELREIIDSNRERKKEKCGKVLELTTIRERVNAGKNGESEHTKREF